MTKYKKSPMREGQNKMARFFRLDELLRTSEGVTLREILADTQIDNISKRLLRDNLKEIEETYEVEYADNMYRGRERLWRYKDINFSILKQTSTDLEVIHKSIEKLNLFKGDPRYDMLRFYLIGLEKGVSNLGVNIMSFDNNSDVEGLEYIEILLDAIINHYPLKMIYQPFEKPAFTSNFHPHHLRQYNNRWFVFGYVEDSDEVRNYPLDRIKSLQQLSKPYKETELDFEEYFGDIVGVTNNKNAQVEKVLLRVSNTSINYIRTKPLHGSQKIKKELSTDEFTTIELNVKVNQELKMLLFSYGDAIEVLEPLWLRENFQQNVKNMSTKYQV